jgi:hypothetical protein
MRKHYYNLSFVGEKGHFRSAVLALDHNTVTIPDISLAKQSLDMDDSTGLISVSYLGLMTEHEYFHGLGKSKVWRRWLNVAAWFVPFLVLALVLLQQR